MDKFLLYHTSLAKISNLEAHNAIYRHDFICISETFFDSSVTEGDKNIQLNGYNLIKSDHPSNVKGGGFVSSTNTYWLLVLLTHQTSVNALFLKSLFKIAKIILVTYTGLQAKILLNLKIFF